MRAGSPKPRQIYDRAEPLPLGRETGSGGGRVDARGVAEGCRREAQTGERQEPPQ